MSIVSGWDLLQSGRYEAALARFNEEYSKDESHGTLTNIGITYLCMGDFVSAKKLFDEMLMEKQPVEHSGLFAYSGLVAWLLKDYAGAVACWAAGLNCDYTDEAGGLELPLLLFYAAVTNGGVYSLTDAEKLIGKRLQSEWALNWPGPIGRYLVEKLDEKWLMEHAHFENEQVEMLQETQATFYVGVEFLRKGNTSEFFNRMKHCGNESHCEVLYEQFLARSELEKMK